MSLVTVWDGKFIRFEEATKAATDAAAGKLQIWKGVLNARLGWDPGFYMKYPNEFTQGPPLYNPPPADAGTPVITVVISAMGKPALSLNSVPWNATDVDAISSTTAFPAGSKILVDGRESTVNSLSNSDKTITGSLMGLVPGFAESTNFIQVLLPDGKHTNAVRFTRVDPNNVFPHATDSGAPGIGISDGGIKDSMTVAQPTDGSDLSIYDNNDQAPSLAAGDKLFYDGRLLVTNFVPDGYNAGQNEIHLLLNQLTVPERAVGVHHYQVQTAAGLWTNPVTVTYTASPAPAPPVDDEPDPIDDPIDVVIPPADPEPPCPPKKSK